MPSYENELKKLNAAQRQAVETIEGPVMVVAGPGTGKTQVVALRIAAILQRTQLGARNILALTFTEAGVTALRERLTQLIGASAYQVTINTFHGFANEVIGTFPHIFTVTRNLTQMDELERLLLLERIIKRTPELRLLRPLRSETRHVRDIASAIRQAKQEAISPDQLAEHAKKLIGVTSTKKAEQLKNERTAGILAEFAILYSAYQAELTATARYDYEDMILFVIAAMQDNPEVKAYFQERYQYILVDEYQDTNNAQNRLVEILADFFTIPNLFVVGDDKQAIYRFQGASVSNMLHFAKKYPALAIISLNENYRSTPEILASADELIANNRQQLSAVIPQLKTELKPSLPIGVRPTLFVGSTALAEQAFVTAQLQALHKKGVPWQEMALLVRTNVEANAWRDIAERAGLPVAGVQSADLLREHEVQLLLQILRAVLKPTDDVAVAAALRSQLAAEQVITLLELIRDARNQKISLVKAASGCSDPAIKSFAEQLLAWHLLSQKLTIVEAVEEVLYKSGILEATRAKPTHLAGLELIAALIDHAREFAKRHQTAGLQEWLDYMALHYEYGIQFSINRCRAETNGIFINTVHQAKGLEFAAVFIPNATDKNWRVKPDRQVVKLPQELLGATPEVGAELEDLRRLFYVAVTRAKHHLSFSYSASDATGRDQLPSQLIVEMEKSLDQNTEQPGEATLSNFITKQIQPLPEENLSEAELGFIRERVTKNPLSFTAYWDYKTCPRTYLLQHVYCLPTPFEPSLVYGSAVHKALEYFGREQRSFKVLPSVARLLELFTDQLTKDLPFTDKTQYLEQGRKVLTAYYEQVLITQKTPPVEVEYSFRPHQVMLGDVWLAGKLDRVETIDAATKTVRVIDYKTGATARSRNYIEGKTQDSDGKIKAQLVFYALLCQLDPLFPYKAKEYEIRFVDDELKFKNETFTVAPEEIKAMAADVKASYLEILTRTSFPIQNIDSPIALLFPSLV